MHAHTHTRWEQHWERICVAVTVCSCDSTFISALTQIGPHGWHCACVCVLSYLWGLAAWGNFWFLWCEVKNTICLRSRWSVEKHSAFTFVNAVLNFVMCVRACMCVACACASLKRRTTPQFHSSVHFDVEWFPYHDCFRSFDPHQILVHCSFEWDLYSGDRGHTL